MREARKSGGHRKANLPTDAVQTPLEAWRGAILARGFVALLTAATLALIILVFHTGYDGSRWLLVPPVAIAWLLLAVGAARPRWPNERRAALLVAGVGVACFGSIANGGYHAPNAFTALAGLLVVLSLYSGARTAGWALLAMLVALSAVGFGLFVFGGHTVRADVADESRLDNWVRVLMVFAGVTGGLVSVVSLFTSRLESSLRHTQKLLDALSRESAQRLAALEQQSELEQQLRQSQKLEAIGTLAGGIAHDFNNLLLVIGSHAEMIEERRGGGSERDAAALTQIHDAVDRAAELTRQLLTFSRRRLVERGPIELNAALERTLSWVERLMPDNVDLRFEPCDSPLYVWGANVDLDQLTMNLCINARDAMPEGGCVRLTLCREAGGSGEAGARARLEVRDSGTGMSDAVRERIFDPFFTTKDPQRGTGLGLSVVHGIVSEMGGSIDVQSQPGEGTCFRLTWPLCDAKLGEPSVPSPVAAGLRGQETVLLVDDDPAVRDVLAHMLRQAGYRVLEAEDGERALTLVQDHREELALVISDVVMPRLGGRALYDAVEASKGRTLPFLFCSGHTDLALTEGVVTRPDCALLDKPFTRVELLTKVAQLLQRSRVAAEPAEGETPARTELSRSSS